MNLIRAVEHFLHELRRNKVNSFTISENQVPRHNSDATNPHRHINPSQHHVPDGSRIGVSKISRHIDLRQPVEIADTAIHHKPPAVGRLHHVVEKIVPHNGAVHFLPKQIDHKDVPRLQHVNRSLVHEPRQASFL